MLVGLIDGDGYIAITKTYLRGYISVSLVIAVEGADIRMLEYLQSVLQIGAITYFPATNTAKYIINRTDLQEVLFPLLIHHNLFFLTVTRQLQYNKAMYILANGVKLFSLIPAAIPYVTGVPSSLLAEAYLALPFFNN